MENLENYKEMLSFFLPEGILNYFDCNSIRKIDGLLSIRLTEKNNPLEIQKLNNNQKIVSKGFKDFLVDDFPVRGRRVKLYLRRRVWQIQETDLNHNTKPVGPLIKNDIPIVFPNTRLNKEFADFLKDTDRARANGYC